MCFVHARKSISHNYTFTANGTHFIAFWLSILHIIIISEAPNLISTFILMLIVISLTGDVVEVCSVHVRKSISHKHTFTANGTFFIAFLALNFTHIISEAQNSISTFNLMLIVIFLSFISWRRG